MNKNIKLAVAGAVFAAASAANAGIIIPAGDWTVDIGGNVNSFYTHTKLEGNQVTAFEDNSKQQVQTGLLPSALGIGAKTRQNDLDVAVQFSFFTGSNANGPDNLNVGNHGQNGGLGYSSLNIRQSFLSFGDKSWGSFKLGRDLGVFGSDAILSDMTLLGVGSGAGGAGSSTLGRIGSGYIYADWKAQIAYTTPNFNGFEATAAVTEGTGQLDNSNLGYEGKASYSFAANDVTGKIWVGGKSLKIQNTVTAELDAQAAEIGGKVGASVFDLVGYYYDGKNVDQGIGVAHATSTSTTIYDRDNSGGYVQATYVMPFKTKLGVSYGLSKIDKRASEAYDAERKATIVGAYHPLTKHLNLVAEYNHLDVETHTNNNGKAKTMSLGAILFF